MNIAEGFKVTISFGCTILTYLFGEWNTALIVLIMFIIMDYISGLMAAYVNRELSSDTGMRGISKKFMIIIILIAAVCLDRLLTGGKVWMFRTVVCYFYVANEGLSLLENAARIGIPIPEKLKKALVQLQKDQQDSKED